MSEGEWFGVRKRPVEVEARGPYYDPTVVETLEGDFEVDEEYADGGFYIIRGVEGEVYPCHHDIFHDTYETLREDGQHGTDGKREGLEGTSGTEEVDQYVLVYAEGGDPPWQIKSNGEFVVGGTEPSQAFHGLSSVVESGRWYTNIEWDRGEQ